MKKSTKSAAPTAFAGRRLPRRSIGEEFGQYEPLTTRLKRLLEDYTDGFSVLKELVQMQMMLVPLRSDSYMTKERTKMP